MPSPTGNRIIGAIFVILAVISAIGFYPAVEVISYKQEESDLPTIPQAFPTRISVHT